MRELIVDLFAGGGGASTAICMATGRHPDIAVNHNPDAVAVHRANHPETRHYCQDVFEVDPLVVTDGQPVGLLWASPDCTHFSKARGGKPVEKKIRSLAWVVVEWAKATRPRVIALENVEEFQDWGPVLDNGKPDPAAKGLEFRRWKKALEDQGYAVEWRELVAADYGAPTTRKRLFLIARRDGEPIRWPAPSHASRAKLAKADLFTPAMKPWRAAAEIIDWTQPVPSIFDRSKPLAPKTLARIAKGVKRFVVEAPRPFIVPVTHTGPGRVHDTVDPLRTITGANRGEFSLVAPTLVPRYGEREGQEPRALDAAEPYPTVVPTGNGGDLAATFLQKMTQNGVGSTVDEPLHTAMAQAPRHYQVAAYLGRQFGSTVSGRDVEEAHPTVTAGGGGGKSQVVAAAMVQHNGDRVGRAADEPVTTLTGRSTQQTVMAVSLDEYYGVSTQASAEEPVRTVTAKDRHSINAAFLEQANTGMTGHSPDRPVSTIVGKGCTQRLVEVELESLGAPAGSRRRQVVDFLWQHFGEPTDQEWADPAGTAGGRLKFGLVLIDGTVWQIVDIGMRMLVPRELFGAQGFPADYIIDRTWGGRPVTKTAQTSMAGNSVSPPPAAALLRANLCWMALPEEVAA